MATVADHVPEVLGILGSGGRLDILLGTVLRVSVDRTRSRCRQLCLDLCLLLQTLDLCAQVLDLLCHLVVLLHGLSLYQTVLAAVLLQKVLGLLPESVALGAQFQNLTHSVCPP